MKVKIISFKSTGKWYGEFEIEIPEETLCFQTEEVLREIYKVSPNLKEFFFTAKIDGPQSEKWFWRMFKPIEG